VGGETPRLEGESEKECAAEWGGVREPSEDGENIAEFIAEFDISAGGEQLGGEALSWPCGRFSFWRLEIARLSRGVGTDWSQGANPGSAFSKRGGPGGISQGPLYVGSCAWRQGPETLSAKYLLQNQTLITSFSMLRLSDTN